MFAAEKRRLGIVKALLQTKGIDVNARDNYGKTALTIAEKNGNHEIVEALLQAKGIM